MGVVVLETILLAVFYFVILLAMYFYGYYSGVNITEQKHLEEKLHELKFEYAQLQTKDLSKDPRYKK